MNYEMFVLNSISNDGFMMTNKKLCFAFDLNTSALLGELTSKYKYFKERKMLTSDGMFFCTVEDLYKSTSIKRMTQFRIIKVLEKKGILETKQRGIPQKRYFKINFENRYLISVLSNECAENGLESNAHNLGALERSNWDDCNAQIGTNEEHDLGSLYNKNNVIRKTNKKQLIISTKKNLKNSSDSKTKKADNVKHAHKERDRELKEIFTKEIWERYPKLHRVGERICLAKFKSAIKRGVSQEEILEGFNRYLKVIEINQRKGTEQFIKRLDNWFAAESWKNPNMYMQSPAENKLQRDINKQYPANYGIPPAFQKSSCYGKEEWY